MEDENDSLGSILKSLLVSCPELQFCPDSLNVTLAEDDNGPPAVGDTLDYLVRNHPPNLPVQGVDAALVRGMHAAARGHQARVEDLLHKLGIMVGIGYEGIILLVIVCQVFREQMPCPGFGEQPDSDVLPVTIAEEYHYHDYDGSKEDENIWTV